MGFEQWAGSVQFDSVHDSTDNTAISQLPINGDVPGQILYQTVGPGQVQAFRYMRNQAGTATNIAVGDACKYDTEGVKGIGVGGLTDGGSPDVKIVPFTVATNDYSVGLGAGSYSHFCGVACAAITRGQFGYFQVRGQNAVALTTDGNVAAGDFIRLDIGGTDGRVIPYTESATSFSATVVQAEAEALEDNLQAELQQLTAHRVGMAFSADASTSQAVGTASLLGDLYM